MRVGCGIVDDRLCKTGPMPETFRQCLDALMEHGFEETHLDDAIDCAFSTAFGAATLSHFEVWAYQVQPGQVSVGDPVDLSKRLDGTEVLRGLS